MPDIRHLVFIHASPAKIYEAITTQKGIASWWSPDNNAKAEKGNIYRISFGGDYFKEIRVTELDSPKSVRWEILNAHPEWLGTNVTFDIRPGKNSTELRFNHAGWKVYTDMYDQCNHHWGVYLENLKAYAEKGKVLAMAESI